MYNNSSRKIFEYKGELWHHLECKPNEILKRHNDWHLSNYHDYTRALLKEIHKMTFNNSNAAEWSGEKKKDFKGNTIEKSPMKYMSKDHLEVFIERVK